MRCEGSGTGGGRVVPDFTVGGGERSRGQYPFGDFSQIKILGNAGRTLNQLVYERILSPYVTTKDEGQLAPGGGVRPGLLFAIRSTPGLARKLFLDSGEVNPSAAELLRNQLPNGQVLTAEELAALVRGLPDPRVLPMWNADPLAPQSAHAGSTDCE